MKSVDQIIKESIQKFKEDVTYQKKRFFDALTDEEIKKSRECDCLEEDGEVTPITTTAAIAEPELPIVTMLKRKKNEK